MNRQAVTVRKVASHTIFQKQPHDARICLSSLILNKLGRKHTLSSHSHMWLKFMPFNH